MKRLAFTLLAVAACNSDVDPQWQLDHSRVIAVRTTPSRIVPGEVAEVDALLGREGDAPLEVDPDTAEVVSPTSLASTLSRTGTRWRITAPSDTRLASARSELGLAATDPVPLRIRVTFSEPGKTATKVVWLGEQAANPALAPILIDGVEASTLTELSVGAGVDVPVSVAFDDDTHDVNWLTSCGTMHDFDLPAGYLRVEPEDPQEGSFAVVVRDDRGGVSWRVWPIVAR